MEDPQSPSSPLSAFPNEHPTPSPQKKSIYKSKLVLGTLVFLILVCIGGSVAYVLPLSQKKAVTPTPSPMTFVQPSPKNNVNAANSYTNTTYSYAIENVLTQPTKQTNTNYSYSEFLDGCFTVYAIPNGTENTLPLEKNAIPWNQLNDLKNLAVGNSKNCSTLSFTFAQDGHAIINKNEYTRLKNKSINNTDWYSFTVSTGADNGLTAHNVYFTQNNTYFYLIETKEGGSCPAKTPTDMFTNFLLIK